MKDIQGDLYVIQISESDVYLRPGDSYTIVKSSPSGGRIIRIFPGDNSPDVIQYLEGNKLKKVKSIKKEGLTKLTRLLFDVKEVQ